MECEENIKLLSSTVELHLKKVIRNLNLNMFYVILYLNNLYGLYGWTTKILSE